MAAFRVSKKDTILERQEEAWKLRTQHGMSETRIGEALGVSQGTISRDLQATRERVRDELRDLMLTHQADQLKRLGLIYDEAMNAWQKSKNPRTTLSEAHEKLAQGERTVKRTLVAQRDPSVKYLDAAMRSLRDMRHMLGIEDGLGLPQEEHARQTTNVLVVMPDNSRGDRDAVSMADVPMIDVVPGSFLDTQPKEPAEKEPAPAHLSWPVHPLDKIRQEMDDSDSG